MTREEAIKLLEQIKDGFISVHNGNPVMYGFSDYGARAFDVAIEALTHEETHETHGVRLDADTIAYQEGWNDAIDSMMKELEILKVDVERRSDGN